MLHVIYPTPISAKILSVLFVQDPWRWSLQRANTWP